MRAKKHCRQSEKSQYVTQYVSRHRPFSSSQVDHHLFPTYKVL